MRNERETTVTTQPDPELIEQAIHVIASQLDRPSVYMAPSPPSQRKAREILEALDLNGFTIVDTEGGDGMTRKDVARRRAQVVKRTETALRADLDRLRAQTADCYSSDCWCHAAQWQEISSIRFLLGEDPTA